MTAEEMRLELAYLERVLGSIESWFLRKSAEARIRILREELKRLGALEP
jgi:hypothetical protein